MEASPKTYGSPIPTVESAPGQPAAGLIAGGVFLLAFIPVGYVTTAVYMATAPFAYYGPVRAWNERVSALPQGKNAIRFSTGDVVPYTATVPLIALGVLMLLVFLLLASSLAMPILHAIRLGIHRIAPQVADALPHVKRTEPTSDATISEQP